MRRRVEPELLDSDAGTPEEVAAALADLRAVNRRFGGISGMRKLVERVVKKSGATELSLLDVGAGSGDVPLAVALELRSRGIAVRVTLCDRAATHLPRGVATVVGDATALPFRDEAFDIVSCSLFLHHLEPEQIGRFVREARRVARRAVLISDLRRSWMHYIAVWCAAPLFHSAITVHDSRASVRRAYTRDEVVQMLLNGGVNRLEIRRSYFFRMAVVAWK